MDAVRLRELYQNARALVFAGVEDFGIAFAESQACGTPVVAFDRGGARDIVIDRDTGILFPEATVAGLKAAIGRPGTPGPGPGGHPPQQPAFFRRPLPRGVRAFRRRGAGMIRKQREQLARLFALSDAMAVSAAFLASFWLRFHSGLLRVPKGVPGFSSYLAVIPFLLFIHMVYFSYQGFYRFKLRRNRLDDLFSVILNCAAAAFTVLLVFSYLKSYRFIDFEISHVFLVVYAPLAVLAIFCAAP